MGKGKLTQDHPLSPLPVVVSTLFEQNSDTIVDIIGLCGVEVDSRNESCWINLAEEKQTALATFANWKEGQQAP